MEDYTIYDVIERSQKMILKMGGISPATADIIDSDDNFITIGEWGEGDDGDDTYERTTFRWDYANLALIPVRGM